MSQSVAFVFVLYKPSLAQKKRAFDIVIDNTVNNRGYGGGANEGIRQALERGAEWVVVCNQDVQLSRKAQSQLHAIAQKCEPCIFGPEAGSFDPKRWTTMLPPQGSVDYISGSCMAIHRKVIEKIGYFYEPYFMYYEDADYCVRAKKAGFPLKQVRFTGFNHQLQSCGWRKDYYLARNHLLFVLRQAPLPVKFYEFFRLPKTLFSFMTHLLWNPKRMP